MWDILSFAYCLEEVYKAGLWQEEKFQLKETFS